MSDCSCEEVAEWFAARGYALVVYRDGDRWLAGLTPRHLPRLLLAPYGEGSEPEIAALRAKERYERAELLRP